MSSKKKNKSGKSIAHKGSSKTTRPKNKVVPKQRLADAISWKTRRVHLGILLVLSILAFLPMLSNGFTNWDDLLYIVENNMIRELNMEQVKAIFSTPVVSNYHPITMLTFAINYQISGLSPFGYNLTSLLLHLTNVALVYLFIYKLSEKKHWVAIGTALFFAIHPMHVESVAWVSERKDLLYTLFYLLGLIVYLDYIKWGGFKKLILIGLLFVVSILSKPAAVVFPITLLLLDYYKGRKLKPIVFLEKIPFLVLSVIFGLIAIQIQSQRAIASVEVYTFLDRIQFAGFGSVWYLVKLVAPYHLSALHPFPENGLSWMYAAAPFVSIAFLAFVFLYLKNKLVNFGVLFYLVNIALVLQFLSVGSAVVAERYTYVSYIGLIFMIGMLIYQWVDKSKLANVKKIAFAGILLVAIGFSTISFFRTKVWHDNESLWNDVIEKYPTSHRAWTNRGLHYYAESEFPRAVADIQEALKHKPDYPTGLEWLGKSLYQNGKFKQALKVTNQFLKIRPNSWSGLSDKAKTLGGLNRFEESLKFYNKAYKINPNNTEILNNRGTLLFNKIKDYAKALNDFSRAIKMEPKGIYYLNRSRCYYMMGDLRQAKRDAATAKSKGYSIPKNFQDLLNE